MLENKREKLLAAEEKQMKTALTAKSQSGRFAKEQVELERLIKENVELQRTIREKEKLQREAEEKKRLRKLAENRAKSRALEVKSRQSVRGNASGIITVTVMAAGVDHGRISASPFYHRQILLWIKTAHKGGIVFCYVAIDQNSCITLFGPIP